MGEIIAYTRGSFWLCLSCGWDSDGTEATTKDQLLEGMVYRCDGCGSIIWWEGEE